MFSRHSLSSPCFRLPWWRHIPHNLEHYFLSGAPFMDSAYYPADVQVSRPLWTEGDRNMSEFFIYAYANFSWYGNPTPKNILGVHWDMTIKEEIQRYLALNTTENSTTLWNYRQKECAFWMEYLPSVIAYITPTYPPTTEFWWEPEGPVQIAFWTSNSIALFLLVMVVICCLLWRNAKRQSKHRYADATAGSLASLKHYPGDFDHIDDKGRVSPALSNRSGFTERSRLENQDGVSLKSFQGGVLQPSPSTHSLRSLGLTRVVGPPAAVPGNHSRAPSVVMGRQPSLHGLPAQGPVQGMMTPAMTPTPQHRPMPPVSAPFTMNGMVGGPGELPNNNNAGPFVNGGTYSHDISNDSFNSQHSSNGVPGYDPRGSRRGAPEPVMQPLSQTRTPTKLVPGRMSQNSDINKNKQQQPPKSPGPGVRQQNGLPSSRPESRAGRQNRGVGVIPSTAV